MNLLNKFYQSAIGGAIEMGLIWAIGWGLGVGGLFEVFIDPFGKILDMWPQVLAIHGFFGGVIFFILLRLAKGRHKLSELSLPRTGMWGAMSGLLLGVLLMALSQELWQWVAAIIGSVILMSAVAAVVSALLFRWVTEGQSPESTTI